MKPGWFRYRARDVCAVCGHGGSSAHPSGCAYKGKMESPEVVLCLRIENGSIKAARDGLGFIHVLKNMPREHRKPSKPLTPEQIVGPHLAAIAEKAHRELSESRLQSLSESLGVSQKSLMRLRLGWIDEYVDQTTGELVVTRGTYSFPMRQAGNLVVGIRLRTRDSQKFSVRGSLNGLFIPRDISPGGTLFVVEGPTEAAVMLDWGFSAIGRPSNTAGKSYCVDYCKRFLPRRPVIILRNNDPQGSVAETHTIAGAASLAEDLMREKAASEVSIFKPPAKDLREWLQQGATKKDLTELIEG